MERENNYSNKARAQLSLHSLECSLNVRQFQKDSLVRNSLVVEHQADAPDTRGETDILDTSQVVKNDFRFVIGCHFSDKT